MSKRRQERAPEKPATVQPPVEAKTAAQPAAAPRAIREHRQCPICWSGCQGYGTAYSTAPNGKTYYRCNKTLTDLPPCGHTWTVVVQQHVTVVEHRTVDLDGQR